MPARISSTSTRSAIRSNEATTVGVASGDATTMLAAPSSRAPATAARIGGPGGHAVVDEHDRPARRPAADRDQAVVGARVRRRRSVRRAVSRSTRSGAAGRRTTTSSFSQRTPPLATAPEGQFRLAGHPQFGDDQHVSGAPTAWATPAATGTPPRGSPSTTVSGATPRSATSCPSSRRRSCGPRTAPPYRQPGTDETSCDLICRAIQLAT